MKNRKISPLLILCFILTLTISCDRGSENSIANNQINVAEAVGSGTILNLSDYATDILYIPLETNEQSILGNIRDIAYDSKKIYVLDNKNVIKIFDNTGKYLTTIDRIGRGPQEYNRISSFKPAPNNKGVYILDSSGDLFFYDNDGVFIEKRTFPTEEGRRFSSFLLMDSNVVVASHSMNMSDLSAGNIDYNIFVLNSSLNIINEKSFSQEGGIKTTMNGSEIASISIFIKNVYLHKYGNQTRFLFDVQDTIFTVNRDGVFKDAYDLNYGKYKENKENSDPSTPAAENKSIQMTPPFFETDHYLFLVFNFGINAPEKIETNSKSMNGILMPQVDASVNAIFNKKTGELILLNRTVSGKKGFVEDLKGGLPFWPSYMGSAGELISYTNAFDIEDMPENDNPVVVIVKPKK